MENEVVIAIIEDSLQMRYLQLDQIPAVLHAKYSEQVRDSQFPEWPEEELRNQEEMGWVLRIAHSVRWVDSNESTSP